MEMRRYRACGPLHSRSRTSPSGAMSPPVATRLPNTAAYTLPAASSQPGAHDRVGLDGTQRRSTIVRKIAGYDFAPAVTTGLA